MGDGPRVPSCAQREEVPGIGPGSSKVQEQDEHGAPVATPAPGLDVTNGFPPVHATNVHAPTTGSASGRSEVAAFVDFENIRYSSINSFGREPDPLAWRDKALKYGLMAVARAYADFDQHPPPVRTRLDVAGFEAQHYPAKRTSDGSGREKIQSRADLNFVIDVINTALTRPDIETFLLFTGDKDFIRLVTTLRNRLGKKVVICGVPGSISPDLVVAAGAEDTLQFAPSVDIDRQIIHGQGQELVMTELNPAHPLVQDALPGFAGHQLDFDVAEDEFQEDDEYEDEDDYEPIDELGAIEDNRGNLVGPGESRLTR